MRSSPLTYYNPTLPYGATLKSVDTFRVQEAYLAANFASHEISIGKSDEWYGPGRGGGMGYSNNAEDIYSVRINRVEPAYIPLCPRFLGPIRYDFPMAACRGTPLTTRLTRTRKGSASSRHRISNSDLSGPSSSAVKVTSRSRGIPSSKASSISTNHGPREDRPRRSGCPILCIQLPYRVPFVRNWLTFYTDSEAHDDVTPISAPRRAGMRPGIYLSHFPGSPKLSWRVEAVSTDPPTGRSIHGSFMYWEAEQRQAYTNKGFTFGDWVGREAKGGQSWLTYHLSGNEWVEFQYRNVKSATDFIPMGTSRMTSRSTR